MLLACLARAARVRMGSSGTDGGSLDTSSGLPGARLCRRARQDHRRLPGPPLRGLDATSGSWPSWARSRYYVHERLGKPLIVTDDDISRHLYLSARPGGLRQPPRPDRRPDRPDLAQLPHRAAHDPLVGRPGQLHRAHRLSAPEARASPAPRSGSIATQRQVVAEQIGAQIFIDGWAMVAPGDPELAADLARRAASVSHDGEAIYGAQVRGRHGGAGLCRAGPATSCSTRPSASSPRDSIIYRMIGDLRESGHAESRTGARACAQIAARATATTSTAATATWCPTTA